MKKIFNLLFLAVLLSACSDKETNNDLAISVEANVAYGSHPRHRMDVYLPSPRNESTPVMFFIHGGGFILGNKEDVSAPARQLAEQGLIVLNINYRRVDTSGLFQNPMKHQPSDITMHDQLDDVDLAIQFAKTKISEWQGSSEDWGIAGHSAGATIALNYVYGGGDPVIKAVGNWAGATTLSFNDESEFDALDPRYKEIFYRVAGAEVTNANKLAFMAISPFWRLYNASTVPATINIRPENNEIGDLPDSSWRSFEQLTQLLNQKNVPNKYIEVAGADHGFNNDWDIPVQETAAFFKAHF